MSPATVSASTWDLLRARGEAYGVDAGELLEAIVAQACEDDVFLRRVLEKRFQLSWEDTMAAD